METYRIDNVSILIDTGKILYLFYLWISDQKCDIILDQFVKVSGDLKYRGIAFSNLLNAKPLGPKTISQTKSNYLNRKHSPKIKIEQYLTHSNKEVRETIKGIIDGSLSNQ